MEVRQAVALETLCPDRDAGRTGHYAAFVGQHGKPVRRWLACIPLELVGQTESITDRSDRCHRTVLKDQEANVFHSFHPTPVLIAA
jgi:uracil-DNA glycosylase